MHLRYTYLYQEDIAQVIESKIPVCLLNNRAILIAGKAEELLCSYLLSNLVALKKFYDLNLKIYLWPGTQEYFHCDCIQGIDKISEVEDKLDYIIDIEHNHQTILSKQNARYVQISQLHSSHLVYKHDNGLVIKLAPVFGILDTHKNVIQNTIQAIVNDTATIQIPNANFNAISAEKAAIGILKHTVMDTVGEVELTEGVINPHNLIKYMNDSTTELNELEKIAIYDIKLLQRNKEEAKD